MLDPTTILRSSFACRNSSETRAIRLTRHSTSTKSFTTRTKFPVSRDDDFQAKRETVVGFPDTAMYSRREYYVATRRDPWRRGTGNADVPPPTLGEDCVANPATLTLILEPFD